jgi:hypothetical protein
MNLYDRILELKSLDDYQYISGVCDLIICGQMDSDFVKSVLKLFDEIDELSCIEREFNIIKKKLDEFKDKIKLI